MTQQPQYQHSPGYNTTGGLPFTVFGMNMSTWQIVIRNYKVNIFTVKLHNVYPHHYCFKKLFYALLLLTKSLKLSMTEIASVTIKT